MLTVYPIRFRFIFGYLLVSTPHICKSTPFNNYLFYMIFFLLRRTGVPPPRFPLVSSCLFCLLPAMLLLSSKTASALSKRQKGYRFYRCPRKLLYIHYESPHTAGTGYGERLFFFNNKSHNCLQRFMFHLNIFITLPVAITFPSHKRKDVLIESLQIASFERINFICMT